MEVLNANMIDNNIKQNVGLERLNAVARKELSILSKDENVISIKKLDKKENK